MASVFEYEPDDLPSVPLDDIRCRAIAAGYTGVLVRSFTDRMTTPATETIEVTVTESPSKSQLQTDIHANTGATLSLSSSAITVAVPPDTQQVTITDSRGAAASGKIVKMRATAGLLPVNKREITLDGSGQGTVTFGQGLASWMTISPIEVEFYYDDLACPAVVLSVTFD